MAEDEMVDGITNSMDTSEATQQQQQTVVLEETFESPLSYKENKNINPKGNQS